MTDAAFTPADAKARRRRRLIRNLLILSIAWKVVFVALLGAGLVSGFPFH